jgi:protein-disulfide isomerase
MNTSTLSIADQDHVRGNPSAPVLLIEYGDYECPYSGQGYHVVQMVKQAAGDRFRFVYRNFPLPQIHPHAMDAAYAAEAAGLQDKFWEMHDTLYRHQRTLDDVDLLSFAQKLGLDMDRFVSDMKSEAVRHKVRADFMDGRQNGVNGTPTFFINGVRFDGVRGQRDLLAAIEDAAQENRT